MHARWWHTFLITTSMLSCQEASLQTRFSVGPTWHRFFSYEVYALTPAGVADLFPNAETLNNELSCMPYIEGRVSGYLGAHLNAHVFGAGGIAQRARGVVTRFFPVAPAVGLKGANDAFCVVKLALADAGVGWEFGSDCFGMYGNPLVGYAFTHEQVRFTLLGGTNTYAVKNTWQGPYVGCELTWNIIPSVSLKPLYKCVIGNVSSQLRTVLTGDFSDSNPDSTRSWRHAAMLGNIFSIEGVYCHNGTWKLGTTVTYMHYQNRKPATVIFRPNNQALVTGALVERLLWEQLVWNCFLEWVF